MRSLQLAWWHWRASWREQRFFGLAVFFCVLTLVGVMATGGHVQAMLLQDSQAMLAADIRLQASHALTGFAQEHLQDPRWTTSPLMEFTANAETEDGRRTMVEVKAVAGNYPLRGRAVLAHGDDLSHALAGEGMVVEASLLTRLDKGIGDRLRLGDAWFTITGLLAREPDRVTSLFSLGPRVLISLEQATATGLIQFGSRVRHSLLLRVTADEQPRQVADRLIPLAEGQGIRVVTADEGQPTVRRFIQRFRLFLTMTGLLAAGVAGVGMAMAFATHLREQKPASAILRTLGATRNIVLWVHLWQALGTGFIASFLATLAGLGLPWLLLQGMAGVLPGMEVSYHPAGWLLVIGPLSGTLMSIALVLPPVWRHAGIKPAELFRSMGWQGTFGLQEGWVLLVPVFLLATTWLLVHQSGDKRLAMAFLLASSSGILLLLGLVRLALAGLHRWHPRWLTLRLAVEALTRRESGSMGVMLALGLGWATVQTLLLLESNLHEQLQNHLPQKAPSFFFMDIQPDQVATFAALARDLAPGEGTVRITPVVRGRLARVQGGEVLQKPSARHSESWRFEREYVLTWADALPANNPLVAGRWWRDDQEVGVSLEVGMAHGLGLTVGDTIGFDIQGVVVEVPITSLRQVRWTDLGLNFFVIFSPATMAGAPASHLATVSLEPAMENELVTQVARQLPNVTAIATRQVMDAIRGLLDRLSRVVRLVASLAMVAGLLVLMISVAASRRRRAREGAICRLLGATRRQLAWAMTWEYLLMGGIASLVALMVAQGITAVIIQVGMDDLWQPYPRLSLFLVMAGSLLTGLVGLAGTWRETGRPIRVVLDRRL